MQLNVYFYVMAEKGLRFFIVNEVWAEDKAAKHRHPSGLLAQLAE